MSGNKLGGLKAAASNREKWGEDWYSRIGAIGGSNGTTGGFAAGKEGRERARIYGRLGGMISSRSKAGKATPTERARIRKEFEKNYKHLLKTRDEHLQQLTEQETL